MSHYILLLGSERPDQAPTIHDSKDVPANTTGVRLGWDRPLNSFFATVLSEGADPDVENPQIHLWVGAEPDSIPSVDALQEALAAWVVIPEALRQRLAWDQAAEASAPVEDLQKYRWFLVTGQVTIDGQPIPILTGAHAADLPEGEAGQKELAERVFRAIALDLGEVGACSHQLRIIELPVGAMQVPNLA